MKIQLQTFLLAALAWSGCGGPYFPASDCSISLGEVTFTKSVNQAADLTEANGPNKLMMKSGEKSDFFNAPDGKEKYSSAPLLLLPIDNQTPFTFTTKVTPTFAETYDAGAVYVFVDNDHWQKFAFEMDERKRTRLVSVRTIETSDDNNHDAVNANSVFLKISSDVESIGYYYSTDSIEWQLTRVYKNDFPANIWLGISAQSPIGKGITAIFEHASLSRTAVKDFRKGI